MHHCIHTPRFWLPRPPAGIATRLAAAILLILAGAAPAVALDATGEIVVVRSSDAQPYTLAGEAIRINMAKLDRVTSVINLADFMADNETAYKVCLAGGKVKVFVAVGTQAAEWLHSRVPEPIMLLYCMVANPDSLGLTKGRSTFGISTTIAWSEQRGLIHTALPGARKIGMLYARKDPDSKAAMEALQAQLGKGYELAAVAVDDAPTVSGAIETLIGQKPDVIWTTADSTVYNSATVRALLLAALRHKIPVFGFSTPFVRAGALLGVGIEPEQQGQQCGNLCEEFFTAVKNNREDEFRKRERIVPPTYQIAINQIVAKQLGRVLPEAFVARASVVVRPE